MALKITDFVVGLVLAMFIMTVLGIYMSHMRSAYDVQYDESTIDAYNKLDEMHNLTKELESRSNIEEKTGVLDIIGGYFTDAYNALKLTLKSFNIFDDMTNQAISDAGLGEVGGHLRVTISIIVLFLIVVGVIIAAIIKRDL